MNLHLFSVFLLVICVVLSSSPVIAQEAKERFTLKHTASVTGVAFSPDGKQIVSGSMGLSDEKSVILSDASTGKEILSLKAQAATVRSVAFSPDGKRIVATDGTRAALWDAVTGKEILSLEHGRLIYSVAFSPDGKRIASAGTEGFDDTQTGRSFGEVKVWDAATGKEILSLKEHADNVWSVAFSPDGKRIVSGSGAQGETKPAELKVWDAVTGKELLSLKIKGHTLVIYSVAFSPDGKRIASASGHYDSQKKQYHGELTVWDAATGKEMFSLKRPYYVTSVAFSPDGKRIVSSGGAEEETKPAELKVWDAATGKELLSLKGHTTGVSSVAFSPDGKRIVSGSFDKTVKVWHIPTDK